MSQNISRATIKTRMIAAAARLQFLLNLRQSVFHLCLTVISLAPAVLYAESGPPKPNLVVFLADDMGWGDSAT